MNTQYENLKPILVSILVHLALLIILSAFVFNPFRDQKWYEFGYEQEPLTRIKISDPTPAGNSQPPRTVVSSPFVRNPDPQDVTPETKVTPQLASPAESDYIEPPSMSEDHVLKKSEYKIPTGPRPVSLLQGATYGGSGIQSNVRSNIEGSSLVFVSKIQKHPFSYTGTVKLQFRITENGKLLPDSVIPLQYPDKNMADFARQLLSQGTFTSRGSFRSDALYEISIEFNNGRNNF